MLFLFSSRDCFFLKKVTGSQTMAVSLLTLGHYIRFYQILDLPMFPAMPKCIAQSSSVGVFLLKHSEKCYWLYKIERKSPAYYEAILKVNIFLPILFNIFCLPISISK